MRTLDRYIVRQFLLNFVILTFVMMSLYVLVDAIINIDEFVAAGQYRAQMRSDNHYVWLWILYALADFYLPMVVLVYIFLSGLLVVAAAGFTLSGLSRSGELIGMVASGISMYRIAAPLLVVGCLLNILTLPLQEYVVPPLANKLARGQSEAKYDAKATYSIRLNFDGPGNPDLDKPGNLLSAFEFDPVAQSLKNVTILVRNEQGLVRQRITADAARWDEDYPWTDRKAEMRRGGWRLIHGQMITRQLGGYEAAVAGRGSQPVGFFGTDLSPQVMLARRATIYPRLLSLSTLREMAANPAADAAVISRIVHSRFSLAVVNALILVMALPYFLLRTPSNLAIKGVQAAAFCLAVWGAAVVVIQAGGQFEPASRPGPAFIGPLVNNLGLALTNPVTAAWLPVVIFLPLAAYRLQKIET